VFSSLSSFSFPASGLDSRASMVVMRVLKRVASTGRAVICTSQHQTNASIDVSSLPLLHVAHSSVFSPFCLLPCLSAVHQPSAALFSFFDRLLLLHRGGVVVYDGSLGVEGVNLVNYFEGLAMPSHLQHLPPMRLPPHTNPASWIMELIGAGTNVASGNEGDTNVYAELDFAEAYRSSALRQQNKAEWDALFEECTSAREQRQTVVASGDDNDDNTKPATVPDAAHSSVYARSSSTQFRLLVARLFLSYYRDIGYNGTRTVLLVLSSVVFGLLWLDIAPVDETGVQSQLSALYFAFYYCSLLQSASILPVVYRWKRVWQHETRVHTYRAQLFPLAMGLVELPYLAVQSLLFSIPFYFLVGFRQDASSFWLFVLLHLLTCAVISGMGEFFAIVINEQALSKIPQVRHGSFLRLGYRTQRVI
jgi:hypothetical protein